MSTVSTPEVTESVFTLAGLRQFGLDAAVDFIEKSSNNSTPLEFSIAGSVDALKEHLSYFETTPYQDIQAPEGGVYMKRDWLIPKSENLPAARIHQIRVSDSDPAAHDHPWKNVSVVLEGCYYELVPSEPEDLSALPQELRADCENIEPMKAIKRAKGDVVCRTAESRHKILVDPKEIPTSLFMSAPKEKEWGFYDERGFVIHTEYLTGENERTRRKRTSTNCAPMTSEV